MRRLHKHQLLEQFIYAAIWSAVFLTPLLGIRFAVNSGIKEHGIWQEIFAFWLGILPFFVLFLLNNYLLAPYFFFEKKYLIYTVLLILLIGSVMLTVPRPSKERFPKEYAKNILLERRESKKNMMDKIYQEEDTVHNAGRTSDAFAEEQHTKKMNNITKKEPRDERYVPFSPTNPPLPPLLPFARIMTAFLLVGFNIAIKLFFKSLRDEEIFKEMENQHLHSELQYLKYQINPHFFMNTLNNIHALVDVDTEKAKGTIIELSKLMRYVLYEAGNNTIQLSREVLFLKNYVALMRLRYIEKVTVRMNFPVEVPEAQIPPLLFISLLENAFKHGVSYRTTSVIEVIMQLEERNKVSFRCRNGNHTGSDEQHHGIGLKNVRKRLKLLFGNDYTLSIRQDEKSFEVLLIIPLL